MLDKYLIIDVDPRTFAVLDGMASFFFFFFTGWDFYMEKNMACYCKTYPPSKAYLFIVLSIQGNKGIWTWEFEFGELNDEIWWKCAWVELGVSTDGGDDIGNDVFILFIYWVSVLSWLLNTP